MKYTPQLVKSLLLIAFVATMALPVGASAQTRYISDTLYVPLRSGMGNQYRIVHRGLESGTRLELLATDTDDQDVRWAKVRTPDGLEGWIRQQYLQSAPTAAIKLKQLQEKMRLLDGDQSQLLDTNEKLKNRNTKLTQQLEQIRDQYRQQQSEYAELQKLSSNAVKLDKQYQKLNENYQLLQTRVDVLTTENQRLKRQRRYNEWLFGAGILIAGVVLSWILQAIGRRKRRSEWG